ncbi:MAG: QcrA and Rieske domain-containing protein [Anaerolineae bacterium]
MSEHATESPSSRLSAFVSRRQLILGGMAAVAAAWAGTAVQSLLFPPASAAAARPVTLPLAELPVGAARPITYGATPALVVRTPESIRCFSLICTHLGCIVQWQEATKEFYCPCHDGRFDQFGEVLAGPPPLPLEQIAVRVEGETVVIGEEA